MLSCVPSLDVICKFPRHFCERVTGCIVILVILASLSPSWAADSFHQQPSHDQALELVRRGELKAAEEMFLALLRVNPESYAVHNDLGALFFSQERYEAACRHFAQAAKLNAQLAAIQQNLGLCLFQTNEFLKAVEAMEKAKELDSEDLRTRYVLGSSYHMLRRLDEAESELEYVRARRPTDQSTLSSLVR